jgi:Glycosyl transferase family 2
VMPYPRVSLIIPVLNDKKNLQRCLRSIQGQRYPLDRLNILVVDGGSTDGSRELALAWEKDMPVRLVDNSSRREAEWGKAIALREANGSLFQCIDADMWFTGPSMLGALVEPLMMDEGLAGAIAPYAFVSTLSVWSRFLSLDAFQRDPLLEKLTPDLPRFVIEETSSHLVCEFGSPRIPPIGGTTMFRTSDLDLDRWGGHFREVDHPAYLVQKGRTRFAFVHHVGWAHEHCRTLGELIRKRRRNLSELETGYLKQADRDYVWWDPLNDAERRRLIAWIVGTHLILPRFIEGLGMAIRTKRMEALLRPVVALAVVDALLMEMLRSPRGRSFLRRGLRPRAVP